MAKEADKLGYDSIWAAEAYGSDAATVLAWMSAHVERAKLASGIFQMPARTPAMTAMTAATLDNMTNGRLHPRPRHIRAPGRRGLARAAVRQAAGPHARVRRDRAQGAGARDAHLRRRVLQAAASRRPGQGPQADHQARAGADPDLSRRDRAEEHGARGRDRRRLAADLFAPEHVDAFRPSLEEGAARAGRARSTISRSRPRSRWASTTTSSTRATSCARTSRSTSAAWAPGSGTSTTSS